MGFYLVSLVLVSSVAALLSSGVIRSIDAIGDVVQMRRIAEIAVQMLAGMIGLPLSIIWTVSLGHSAEIWGSVQAGGICAAVVFGVLLGLVLICAYSASAKSRRLRSVVRNHPREEWTE